MSQSNEKSSHGIQDLINTLRDQGVEAGRQEGTRIIEEAESRSEWLIKQAHEESEKIIEEARREAEYIRRSGKDALEMSYRDVRLKLKDVLSEQFKQQLQSLVQKEMSDPALLAKLIVELAGQHCMSNGKKVSAYIPSHALGLDELRANPEALLTGALSQMVSGVSHEMLRKGVEIKPSEHIKHGVMIKLDQQSLMVDFTDKAVTELLLEHLQPRFRALLEGLIH